MKSHAVIALCGALGCGCASFRHADDPWWGPDKARHMLATAALSAGTSYALVREGGAEADEGVTIGTGAALAAGVGKEVYDQRVKRTYFSGKDLVWDLLGGLAGGFAGSAFADR